MKWLVIITIVSVTVSFKSAFAQLDGTCASIGYADQCCPPGGSCTATDGNCKCDAHCYSRNDCCTDAYCSPTPTTCQQSGITECCDDSDLANCRVQYPGEMTSLIPGYTYYTDYSILCTCDVGCFGRAPPNNCCADVEQIGCTPQTCAQAGKPAGCCQWSATSSCHVNGSADCYCDAYCFVFGDCCCDIEQPDGCADNRDCPNKAAASSTRQRYYEYSNFEKDLMAAHVQKYTAQQQKIGVPNPAQGGPYQHRPGPVPGGPSSSQADRNEHHRLALTSRLERARVNAREFRGRARAMQRPNYYNNYYNGY